LNSLIIVFACLFGLGLHLVQSSGVRFSDTVSGDVAEIDKERLNAAETRGFL